MNKHNINERRFDPNYERIAFLTPNGLWYCEHCGKTFTFEALYQHLCKELKWVSEYSFSRQWSTGEIYVPLGNYRARR